MALALVPRSTPQAQSWKGEHPFWPFSVSVKDQSDARRAVPQLIRGGADFLKVYNTLSRGAYLEIASQAKLARIPFVGHIPDSVTPAEASDIGQKSIEHLWGISPYLSSNPEQLKKMSAEADNADDPKTARDLYYQVNQTILSSYDSKKAGALFERFVNNSPWQTPTLVVLVHMHQSMTLAFVETLETSICPMTCVSSGTPWAERPIPVTTRFNFGFLPATLRSLEPCILLVFRCLQVQTLRIRTHIQALACMRNCNSSNPPD